MLADYIDSVRRSPIEEREKLLCMFCISKWAALKAPYLAKDIIKAMMWPFVPKELKSHSRKEKPLDSECGNVNPSAVNVCDT